MVSLTYRTQDLVKIDIESFELEHIFKCDRNILVLPHQFTKSVLGKVKRLTSVRQQDATLASSGVKIPVNVKMSASMGSSIIQSRSWHEYSGSNEPEQWLTARNHKSCTRLHFRYFRAQASIPVAQWWPHPVAWDLTVIQKSLGSSTPSF